MYWFGNTGKTVTSPIFTHFDDFLEVHDNTTFVKAQISYWLYVQKWIYFEKRHSPQPFSNEKCIFNAVITIKHK